MGLYLAACRCLITLFVTSHLSDENRSQLQLKTLSLPLHIPFKVQLRPMHPLDFFHSSSYAKMMQAQGTLEKLVNPHGSLTNHDFLMGLATKASKLTGIQGLINYDGIIGRNSRSLQDGLGSIAALTSDRALGLRGGLHKIFQDLNPHGSRFLTGIADGGVLGRLLISDGAMGALAENSGVLGRLGLSNGPLGRINDISKSVLSGLPAYNEQLRLSEMFTESFANAARLSKAHLGLFTADNFVTRKGLNVFDLISGASFYKTAVGMENDAESLQDVYAQIDDLLSNNEDLKEEILSLQSTLLAMQSALSLTGAAEEYKVHNPETLMEWFGNKILIRKLGIKPQVAMVLLGVIFVTITVLYTIVINAKSTDILNYITGSVTAPGKTDTIRIYIQAPIQINDFTICEAAVYSNRSKTKERIGVYKANTTLLIIKIKEGWCLVEGLGVIERKNNRRNRKQNGLRNGPVLIEQKIRGWVSKHDLDMFQ